MSEILYKLTAKLLCRQEATAFLINEKIALTARHAIVDNIKHEHDITLQFYIDTDFENNVVGANLIAHSEELDIAILELIEPVTHVSDWPTISSQMLDPNDNWETVGFPINWNASSEGSDYCFLKGEIYEINNLEKTIYDLHLSSIHVKDEWEYDLKGLSGSPVLIDGEIKGIIINEEYSLVKSAIKAISVNKAVSFLDQNGININSSFGPKQNLVNERLDKQKNTCEDLFKKLEYRSTLMDKDMRINYFHIQYDEDGTTKMKDLATYLSQMVIDYACTLEDTFKSTQSRGEMMRVFKKTSAVIKKIRQDNKLGSLLLWMLMEGILNAPKSFVRISMNDNNNISSEVHIGINTDNQLVLYLGDGKLNSNLKSAVSESLEIVDDIIDVQDDIFMLDNYIYNQMESNPLKRLLDDFNNITDRNWDNVVLQLVMFTGYDSLILKQIEDKKLPKNYIEAMIQQKYKNECLENDEFISKVLKDTANFGKIEMNWFVLPFNTIEEFEELILHEITEAEIV